MSYFEVYSTLELHTVMDTHDVHLARQRILVNNLICRNAAASHI